MYQAMKLQVSFAVIWFRKEVYQAQCCLVKNTELLADESN